MITGVLPITTGGNEKNHIRGQAGLRSKTGLPSDRHLELFGREISGLATDHCWRCRKQEEPERTHQGFRAKKVSFEEFPLVLAEAMGFGVVPVVYHSFAAAKDIIEDGKDGFLIPYSAKAFPAESMANAITPLMNDKERLQHMAEAAIQKSQLFGIDSIYKQWMKLLN